MNFPIPHIDNVDPVQNRVSVFACHEYFDPTKDAENYFDPFYGRMWTCQVKEGAAVYGQTESFTKGPLDHLGTGKFLRVPYRRIPIIAMDSYEHLLSFAKSSYSMDSSIKGMWRGQNQLYTLDSSRTKSDRLKLYGSDVVMEPSLLPSALRLKLNVDDYASALFGLLDIHIERRHLQLSEIYGLDSVQKLEQAFSDFRRTYLFRSWAFGIAQHYGFPSTGLDLTPDIEIAVFFALHRFNVCTNGFTTITRLDATERPVVFLMGVFEYDLIVDKEIAPQHLHTPRAAAQKAHFFATAWGQSPNRAAERIVAAFELRNHSRWSLPDLSETLFPTLDEDHYSAFFKRSQAEFGWLNGTIPLSKFYFR
ncbi:hypothetical protein [Prosthecobacter fluviatilis]|uniref:FRG domain-containing protein n=1 Tax=Prosthecobacter fluviatilis TaxID=445931 RepID=A0ABW0KK67_9BACT